MMIVPQRGNEITQKTFESGKKLIWRNKAADGYKIGLCYEDVPLDLSHYLLMRSREQMILQNKLENKVNSGAISARLTEETL